MIPPLPNLILPCFFLPSYLTFLLSCWTSSYQIWSYNNVSMVTSSSGHTGINLYNYWGEGTCPGSLRAYAHVLPYPNLLSLFSRFFRSTSTEMRRSSIIRSRLTHRLIRSTCMEWSRTWTTRSRCLPGTKWVKASEAKQFKLVNKTTFS